MPRKEYITGIFQHVKHRNLLNSYTVFTVRKDDGSIVTCTGCIIPPKSRVMIGVVGVWQASPHGMQLTECSIRPLYTSGESLRQYLLSIDGIGPKLAETITQRVGNDFQFIIDNKEEADAIEMLSNRAGISTGKALLVIEHMKKEKAFTSLFLLLSRTGCPYSAIERIYTEHGVKCVEQFLRSPFAIGSKAGVPFHCCDSIAMDAGLDLHSDERFRAAAGVVMNQQSGYGHVCLPVTELAKRVRLLLNNSAGGHSASTLAITNAILSDERSFAATSQHIYLRKMYWAEKRTARAISRIIQSGIRTDCDPEELCAYAESVCRVTYAEKQREIFKMLQHGGLGILTGGPGTGKTTVVKGFLAAYEKLFPGKVIKLCAPTGRASQRMKEATGREASTVHRILDYQPFGDSAICKNEKDPINADCIVLDEASMLSIDVAELFFNAVRPGALVLLVGDVDQLPSVGPGNVLGDLIKSGVAPVIALKKPHRQGRDSMIYENAERTLNGDSQFLQAPDFEIVPCDDSGMQAAITHYYMQYHNDDDPFVVQVLMPARRKRYIGSKDISACIQKELNRTKVGSVRYGDTLYCIGDKIMMHKNNYSVGYFNGDIGKIIATNSDGVTVGINGEKLLIPNDCLEDMSLAYASTIHKAQGSEFSVVIVGLPSEPLSMLQRGTLFTAITRAKRKVILIASDGTIHHCVSTVTTAKRYSNLCVRLQSAKL